MSIWAENNTIDEVLRDLQTNAPQGVDGFIERKIQRKKARKLIEEVVSRHYHKKGTK